MPLIARTNSEDPNFISLVRLLDTELAERDGDDHQFYAQFNMIAKLKHTVVAYHNDIPVACGAVRELEPSVMEVKRMYCLPTYRGKGIAKAILAELELWSRELGYACCRLETGMKQPEAIKLYSSNGYHQIPNYGQYAGVYNSVCFEKTLG